MMCGVEFSESIILSEERHYLLNKEDQITERDSDLIKSLGRTKKQTNQLLRCADYYASVLYVYVI